jgi:hypothetical protein
MAVNLLVENIMAVNLLVENIMLVGCIDGGSRRKTPTWRKSETNVIT